jgi:hypothetical protein
VLELGRSLSKRAKKYFAVLEKLEAKFLLQSIEECGIPFDFPAIYDVSATTYHNQAVDKLDIIYRNNKYLDYLILCSRHKQII